MKKVIFSHKRKDSLVHKEKCSKKIKVIKKIILDFLEKLYTFNKI